MVDTCKYGVGYLTQLGNAEPVFLPVVYNKEPSPIETLEFWKKVDNVMQWHHLLHLENPRSSIKLKDIRLDLFRSTGKKNWWAVAPEEMDSIADWSQAVVYDYQADQSGEMVPASFALRITNQSQAELFVSAMFLSGRFGINNRHLPNARLQPGQEVWMTTALKKNAAGEVTETTRSIGLSIDQAHYEAGISEQTDYIKLIIAKQDFDTTGFNQDPLLIRGVKARTRDAGELPIIEEEDWTTQQIPIRIVRPGLRDHINA